MLKQFPKLSETFVIHEILELERQGADVIVFSLKRPASIAHQDLLRRLKANVVYLDQVVGVPARSDVAAAAKLSPWKHGVELEKLTLQAGYIARLAATFGLSHLHAHFMSNATTVAMLAAQEAGISFSFTAHARDIFHTYASEEADQEALVAKLEAAAFAATVSEFNIDHLRCKLPAQLQGKLRLVYNGVDLRSLIWSPPSSKARSRIGFVGRLVEKKGALDLIEACALLRARGVQFDCRIIGEGSVQPQLHALIEQLSLQDVVTLAGPQEHAEVLTFIANANILVLPSKITGTGDRDALPTVLLEALALGTPVVSTCVSGIPEIVEHGKSGLLVPSESPHALADAIAQVLGDDALAHRLSIAGRRRMEDRFDCSRNVAIKRALFIEHARCMRGVQAAPRSSALPA